MAVTTLPAIAREYTWNEIAMMTRARRRVCSGLPTVVTWRPAPGPMSRSYRPQADRAAMFRNAALVFKDGQLVMRDGATVRLRVRPHPDRAAAFRCGDRPAPRRALRNDVRHSAHRVRRAGWCDRRRRGFSRRWHAGVESKRRRHRRHLRRGVSTCAAPRW